MPVQDIYDMLISESHIRHVFGEPLLEAEHKNDDLPVDEVAPPDKEKLVKKLKKKGVKNPWALAWKIHNEE